MKKLRTIAPSAIAVVMALSATSRLMADEANERTGAGREYLQAAIDFADCMIQYGRDRYGEVYSPLFANSLTREAQPHILPQPLFAEPQRVSKKMNTPFRRFDFNKALNYPSGLGPEGPHKVTVHGCDPYEDRDLYAMLFDLTRITGDPKYEAAATEALAWWFRHTQGPAGLFPWGEHLGWDFEYECPTYFDGPSEYLYAACYHEVKDEAPFLEILAALPATRDGDNTPLERYALGIWNAHFWDKNACRFCRHGDYTGQDDREGSDAGFPAHLAAYMQVWITAYLESGNASFRAQMEDVLTRTFDMAIARTERYGFFPFDFAPELKGETPGKRAPKQSLRLARHARDLSPTLREALPAVADRMEKLARLHLGAPQDAKRGTRPKPVFTDFKGKQSDTYAKAILKNVELYQLYGDRAFLNVASRYAAVAARLFLDGKCPLPKYSPTPLATTSGEPFPDFYFRGAKLMLSFAKLGHALGEGP